MLSSARNVPQSVSVERYTYAQPLELLPTAAGSVKARKNAIARKRAIAYRPDKGSLYLRSVVEHKQHEIDKEGRIDEESVDKI